jgi:hypothetical protein
MNSLPVLYYDKKAWMTSEIFKKWSMSWGLELQRKSRNILLVLYNSTALIGIFKNMQMEFLSLNTTSLVQPMNMEIITNLKTLYCPKLVSDILQEIQENLLISSSATKEVSARTDSL